MVTKHVMSGTLLQKCTHISTNNTPFISLPNLVSIQWLYLSSIIQQPSWRQA
jgi:hypothetical protein